MAKPKPTVTDYIVIALSPVLIMALVGSLCFFLIDVRYQGKMDGDLCWVMFWFVLAIVLISRIAIEHGAERAALFGIALGGTLWLYLIRTSPAYLLGIVLMALVWYCAHKLVWDCTLIDDDQDSSGQGLLQKSAAPKPQTTTKIKTSKITKKPRRKPPESPGRSVLYFSLAALPLFGVGQVLLPTDPGSGRRLGFALMIIYLAAALGLLVTTSFLGLRRYLRQRYLPMPASIAFAWVKFGAGIIILVLALAMFLPRPGATAAWTTLSTQVDQQLRKASQYASRNQPAQPGEGRAANQTSDSGTQNRESSEKSPSAEPAKDSGGTAQPTQPVNAPAILSGAANGLYFILRNTLLVIGVLLAGWWLFRCRHIFAELFRSLMESLRKALLLSLPKPVRPTGPVPLLPRRRPLSEFQNPFYATKDSSRSPEEIILYTYDAIQAWAQEQGIEGHPEQTAREFCSEMTAHLPDLNSPLQHLAFLHAHAAYGQHLPENCDLEPLKELWRRLTWK